MHIYRCCACHPAIRAKSERKQERVERERESARARERDRKEEKDRESARGRDGVRERERKNRQGDDAHPCLMRSYLTQCIIN